MAELDPKTFKLRRFEVCVGGFGCSPVLAASRGKALADVWRSDAFSCYTFGQFLKIARCSLDRLQITPEQIEVSGEQVWGLGHNGQYVKFVEPNGERIFNSHPLDVLPMSARPKAYQQPPLDGQSKDNHHG